MTKPHVRVRREPNPDDGWPNYGPPNRVYLTFRDPKSDKFYSVRYGDGDRNDSIRAQEYMLAELTKRFPPEEW